PLQPGLEQHREAPRGTQEAGETSESGRATGGEGGAQPGGHGRVRPLTKPVPPLTKTQEAQVKKVARDLVYKLTCDLLVLDWKQRQTTLAAVRVGIEETLDECLPDVYDRALFARKSTAVFEHVFSAYEGNGRSIYGQAASWALHICLACHLQVTR